MPRPPPASTPAIPEAGINPEILDLHPLAAVRLPTRAHTSKPSRAGGPAQTIPRAEPVALQLQLGPQSRADGHGIVVSCLMVTRDRFELAKIAIACFRRQTWPSRELLILDTTATDELPRWVEGLGDPRIRVKFTPGCDDRLGDLRNVAVSEAAGSHVCQWDDDDLSHPARIEVQVEAMRATASDASFLGREILWEPRRHRLCMMPRRAQDNTVICRKAAMPRYASRARGEDVPLTDAIRRMVDVVYLDHPELYVYVAHGANTWGDDHMDAFWRAATERYKGAAYTAALRQLSRCFPVEAYLKLLGLA